MSTPSLRKYIEARGGTVRDTRDGIAADFPETDQSPEATLASAKEVEAAVERAKEFGTQVIRLWRARGEGYFAASSHAEHPGWFYLCQIDEVTGQPVRCECTAGTTGGHVCHHLGAAIALWRAQGPWAENDAMTLAAWRDTLALARSDHHQSQMTEEVW